MIPTRKCINLRFESADNQPSLSEISLPMTQLRIIAIRAKKVHHAFSNGIHSGNDINKLIDLSMRMAIKEHQLLNFSIYL